MKKNQGFTLIELIMVVVILGVLSAVALPRFADLGSDARIASLKGLAGSMKSASGIVHAKWLAEGASGLSVSMEGGAIITTATGYPDAVAGGITLAAGIDTTNDYPVSASDGYAANDTVTYELKTNCTVLYDAGESPPEISFVTSGC